MTLHDRRRAACRLPRLLRRARPHAGPERQPDPARQDRAVHGRGHDPVQAVLHRRGAGALPPGDVEPEVRPGGRQAQRPRRHRPHQPPLLVLRDARQLLASATTSRPRRSAFAWELYTEVLGLDPERLWITVHETDDEAEAIWRDEIGVPPERIQRLGDDNFWRMGDTGPCGPSSEIFWDLGPEFGADGGPKDGGEDRYVEIWNLVFMQFDAQPDGTLVPLPKPSVDTGAGLERNLAVLQGVESIWDIDVFRPLIAAAEQVTGVTYQGFPGGDADVSLRILAEHARTMTFLVADGVVPSNEERGYVLRRIIRRAVRHALPARRARPRHAGARRRDGRGDGRRLPGAREAPRAGHERDPARGGAVPRHAPARRGPARRGARRPATSPASARSSSTTRSATRSTSPVRSRRSAAARSTSTGFRGADGRAAHPGARGAQGRGRRGGGAGRALPRDPRRPRPDRVHRPPGVRDRGREGARHRRRRRAARPGRPPATRSTSSSTARRSTPSPVARSATPARITQRRRRDRRAGPRHAVRDRRRAERAPGQGRAGRAGRERRGGRRDRRPAPRRDPPQPHRDPRPALGAARGARHRT